MVHIVLDSQMLVRACVRSFVSKQKEKKNSYKNQENKRAKQIHSTAHALRIIRTPSLFPATGLIVPDDDPTRLPAGPPRAIDRRAAPPTAVETDVRGATMLLTRDVGGRKPEGRGPAAPPGTSEALDAVGASLPCCG